jgi:hypothetical protein
VIPILPEKKATVVNGAVAAVGCAAVKGGTYGSANSKQARKKKSKKKKKSRRLKKVHLNLML